MPQINFYTYLSQTTWLIIIFYLFYYMMKQYLLPAIFENIKLKNLNKNTIKSLENNNLVSNNANAIYNGILSNTL